MKLLIGLSGSPCEEGSEKGDEEEVAGGRGGSSLWLDSELLLKTSNAATVAAVAAAPSLDASPSCAGNRKEEDAEKGWVRSPEADIPVVEGKIKDDDEEVGAGSEITHLLMKNSQQK